MSSRLFKFAFVGFQALWFLFVLPGHTRGLLNWTRPKAEPGKVVAHSCCTVEDAPAAGEKAPAKPSGPTEQQKKDCAVCYYTAGLSVPPVINLEIRELGLLKTLPPPVPIACAEQQHLLTYYACGPPAILV